MIKESKLVTIIVPVYNVEKYLEKCIRNILQQTYEKIEVILIDDGSDDKSGEICDKYEKENEKIKVIHQENGGAARARNVGIKLANGEYITFIDADDEVEEDYIETLHSMIIREEADIAVCKYKKFYTKIPVGEKYVSESTVCLESEKALEILYYRGYLTSSPCAKLFKRELFRQIQFPEGRLYEDFSIIYILFHIAEKIVYNPTEKYYYLQRDGSSMHSKYNDRKWDLITISEEIIEFTEKNYPKLRNAAKYRFLISNLMILREMPWSTENSVKKKKLANNIRKVRMDVFKDSSVSLWLKCVILLTFLPFGIVKCLEKTFFKVVELLQIVPKY